MKIDIKNLPLIYKNIERNYMAMRVFFMLCEIVDDKYRANCSQKYLMHKTKTSKATIHRALKYLIDNNFITKTAVGNRRIYTINRYIASLTETKIDVLSNEIKAHKSIKPRNEIRRTSIQPKIRFLVFKRDKFRCVYCGADSSVSRLEIDHKIPVSKGGKDSIENYVTACQECNMGKGSMVL